MKIKVGDYVEHSKLTLEQYKRFHDDAIASGLRSAANWPAEKRFSQLREGFTLVDGLNYVCCYRAKPDAGFNNITHHYAKPKHPTASTAEEALDMVQDGWKIYLEHMSTPRFIHNGKAYFEFDNIKCVLGTANPKHIYRVGVIKILDNLGNTVWEKEQEPELVQVDKAELERLRSIANSLGK